MKGIPPPMKACPCRGQPGGGSSPVATVFFGQSDPPMAVGIMVFRVLPSGDRTTSNSGWHQLIAFINAARLTPLLQHPAAWPAEQKEYLPQPEASMRLILVSADLLVHTMLPKVGMCRIRPNMGPPLARCFARKPNRAERRRPPPEPKAKTPPPPPRAPQPPSPVASEPLPPPPPSAPLFSPTSKRPRIVKGPRLQGLGESPLPTDHMRRGRRRPPCQPSEKERCV